MANFNLNNVKIYQNFNKRFIVVDDFYENPDQVRDFALNTEKYAGGLGKGFMGNRTADAYFAPQMQQVFENILGMRIANWYDGEYCNGVFQYCVDGDHLVYHCDGQDWAGAIYLTPDAPFDSGTSFYASKRNRQRGGNNTEFDFETAFAPEKDEDPHLNPNLYEKVDDVGNVYNRLVLWDAQLIHAASSYFGDKPDNSRLFHLFFFNVEK